MPYNATTRDVNICQEGEWSFSIVQIASCTSAVLVFVHGVDRIFKVYRNELIVEICHTERIGGNLSIREAWCMHWRVLFYKPNISTAISATAFHTLEDK